MSRKEKKSKQRGTATPTTPRGPSIQQPKDDDEAGSSTDLLLNSASASAAGEASTQRTLQTIMDQLTSLAARMDKAESGWAKPAPEPAERPGDAYVGSEKGSNKGGE